MGITSDMGHEMKDGDNKFICPTYTPCAVSVIPACVGLYFIYYLSMWTYMVWILVGR